MRDPDAIASFRALNLDAAVVVAYGQILVREVLEAPRLGCFNVHASLLPRWRGAAPIQRAIMAGDRETGVQVMRMSEGLDEGAILSTARVAIEADDTAGSLMAKLAEAGAVLLPQTLAAIARRSGGDAAGRGRRHLRQKDQRRRGAHRLDAPRSGGGPDDPRPVALPRRLVRTAYAPKGRCG